MSDDAECPTCERTFQTTRAMKTHHARVHGRSLNERECEYCEEVEYIPPDHRFCSPDCAGRAQRNRFEYECDWCGKTDTAPLSEKGSRRFCSPKCSSRGIGAELQGTGDGREVRTCVCGTSFEVWQSDDKQRCSTTCDAEVKADRPRPDDFEMLLWLLYVYEGHSLPDTHKRVNIVRDEEYSRLDIRDALVDYGYFETSRVPMQRLKDAPETVGSGARAR